MKVTGFSFISNAIKYNYPIKEALLSILPLCDEIVVAVGQSDDNTREMVQAIDPRIRIIDTVWDYSLKAGGKVLAAETDKAYAAIPGNTDWCIYIQGDEVMDEAGYEAVLAAMRKYKDDMRVDGLLFKYRHFFGSYQYIGDESGWYRNEIRIVRKNDSVYSYKDAQGFRKGDNQKLSVKPVNAYIHHYGWVQDVKSIMSKFIVKDKIYFGKEIDLENVVIPADYIPQLVRSLKKYTGNHPAVMKKRIDEYPVQFEYDTSKNRLKIKDRLKNLLENITGERPFDFKNYKVLR